MRLDKELLKREDPETSEGLGDWGPQFPFYQGDEWRDYISEGRLVKEVQTEGFGKNISQALAFLASQPSGTLFVKGADSAIAQIPRSYYAGSPDDLPTGFYKVNTRLTIVKPDYQEGTVTRYTFRLRKLKDVLKTTYDPRLVNAVEDLQDFILTFIPFIDPLELDELGIWVLMVSESTVLKAVDPNRGGALDNMDLPQEDSGQGPQTNLLPIVISGAGLLTGSPLLIGAGLLYRIYEARK